MKEIKSTRQVNATVDNQSTPTITTPDGKPVVSLNDLKAVIPSTNGKALPTAKQLRENDQMILSQPLSDGDIHVYASGFAVYRSDRHTAVLRVDRVSTHTYEFATSDKAISLGDQPWAPALVLAGDKRMNDMLADRYSRRSVGFADDVDEEDSENRGRGEVAVVAGADDVENKVVSKLDDRVRKMLEHLTARQRQIVQMYYFEELTQQEIADMLGIARRVVGHTLEDAISKIQKRQKKF
ncbi:MAG: sigma-70 family RNA polymerase sigma factor [Eubacteriales bacterium]|jgi:RNA polymerase sigma factor (sigma-70 family)|nr:sigma-70 family RNA polymerase sigma factor [Eubacteriales bacterium]MDD4445663.1 sigma-70 family RNA polymerase sigma factor [Eubacteriales bacterium]